MLINRLMLNCDMGESFGPWQMGEDEIVMPWIDMANIACGFHASDPHVMSATIALAQQQKVKIGAHPGYPDLQGFGRRSLDLSPDEVTQIVIYQIGALEGVCRLYEAQVAYVKPHGALYNDMMRDTTLFQAVAKSCSMFNLPLMILATKNNDRFLDIADQFSVPLLFEAFADRSYQANGLLTPRSHPHAVLSNSDDIYHQVMQLAEYGSVSSVNGQKIRLEADTVCIHGDNPSSIAVVRRIHEALNKTSG